MILLIDNFDSFSHNLARYLRQLGQPVEIVRNDEISIKDILRISPRAIILSPGPCTPDEAGISLDVVREYLDTVPILGVCLGHQVLCQALGARIVRAAPMHGRTSQVTHEPHPLFDGIPSPFTVCRYHSLAVDRRTLPAETCVVASTVDDDQIMAVVHRQLPVAGIQFHPESILTDHGYRLLGNYLKWINADRSNPGIESLARELELQRMTG